MQGSWLNYAHRTQVVGVCEYRNDNHYKFCTKQVCNGKNFKYRRFFLIIICANSRVFQTRPTSECMDGWSGALVCPDAAGHYYAVGVFHSHRGNCELGTEKAPTRYGGVSACNLLF